jgi:hypothetical protein
MWIRDGASGSQAIGLSGFSDFTQRRGGAEVRGGEAGYLRISEGYTRQKYGCGHAYLLESSRC